MVVIFALSVMSCDLFGTCTVIFNNQTDSNSIHCYVNNNYQGTVKSQNCLTVRNVFARNVTVKGVSVVGDWKWGPNTYRLSRYETLTYTMYLNKALRMKE